MISTSSIVLAVGSVAVASGFLYVVNDYFQVKSAYQVSQKTVEILQHRNQVLDRLLVSVEEDQTKNYQKQRQYFQEFDDQGYILTDDGRNPQWMRSEA